MFISYFLAKWTSKARQKWYNNATNKDECEIYLYQQKDTESWNLNIVIIQILQKT